MFKTILVPTDGSPLSEKAVHAAIEFARTSGAGLVAISVAEPPVNLPLTEGAVFTDEDARRYSEQMREAARQDVDKVAAAAAAMQVPCTTTIAESFNPYEEILKAAKEFHCDVIFMASHGRKGLSRLFAGSQTQKVLVNSTIPVMVFR